MENHCATCETLCLSHIDLSSDEIVNVSENKVELEYTAGEVIAKQGTFANNILVLRSGIIKKQIKTENNKEIIIKLNLPGNYLGLQTIGIEGAYPYNLIAVTNCNVCVIRKKAIKNLIDTNQSFKAHIFKYYSEDYNFTYRKLAHFGSKNMQGRLAETLLYLNDEKFSEFDIYAVLTRKEIADLSGMSLESSTKILHDFKEDDIIQIEDRRIVVNKQEKLKMILKNS